MALYRGAGGAGDATADSISEASLIKQLAVEVQADADAAEAARAAAVAAKVAAETAETNAETAETNAETAETNAETAASNASSSASAASASATNAASSATAASGSATNAASSATSASSSASSASTSATNASNSASAAATSATNASNSATAAASSASTASTQASNAASSASAASTSATAAAGSATSAASSATTATTQAGIATTQASNAATSATAAQTAETSAETAETNAAASASAAATSATNASNSASAASTSATNASNSASAAATSATNAANSATSAAASATSAANSAASINPSSIAITGGSINGTTVGATAPSTGAFTTLSASGAFSANGGATLGDASGDALTINSSAVSIPNGLNFDSNTLVIDATNNNVGIGTSSPRNNTDFSTLTLQGTAGGVLEVQSSDGNLFGRVYSVSADASFHIGNQKNGSLYLFTNATERIKIDSGGNVGIGTSNPTTKLQVSGTGFLISDINNSATSASDSANLRVKNGTVEGYFAAYSSGGTVELNAGSNHPLVLKTNNTQRVVIDTSGNFAISQAAGKYSLDTTSSTTLIANGGTVDFPSASGMLIVNNHTSGHVTTWLCGAGLTSAIGSVGGTVGSFAHVSGINGYRWTNNSGSSAYFAFCFIRTRTGA